MTSALSTPLLSLRGTEGGRGRSVCPIIADRAALKGSWVSWAGGGSPWDSFCSEAERPGWAQSTGLGGRGARSGYLKMARVAGLQEASPPKPQNVSVRNAVSGFHSRAVQLSWDRITGSLPFFLRPGCPLLWPHRSSGRPGQVSSLSSVQIRPQ